MFDLKKLIVLFVAGILSLGGVVHAASGNDGKEASSTDKHSSSDNKKSSNDKNSESSDEKNHGLSSGENKKVSNDDWQDSSDDKSFQSSKDDGPALVGSENKDSWDGKVFGGHDFNPGLGHAGEHWNDYSTSPIPEPETYAMLLAGLSLLGFLTRRKKDKEL